MKPLLLILFATLCGCETMSPRQKAVAAWSATLIVAIAASSASRSHNPPVGGTVGPGPSCMKQPDGSCR